MSITSINALNTGVGFVPVEPSTSRILAALAARVPAAASIPPPSTTPVAVSAASVSPPAVDQATTSLPTSVFFTPTGQLLRELAPGANASQNTSVTPANDIHFGHAANVTLEEILASAPSLALIEATDAFASASSSSTSVSDILPTLAADIVEQTALGQNLQTEADITLINNLEANLAAQTPLGTADSTVSSLALQGLQNTGLAASLQRGLIARQANQTTVPAVQSPTATEVSTANATSAVPASPAAVPTVSFAPNAAATVSATSIPVATETAQTETPPDETLAQMIALVSTDPAELATVAAYHMTPIIARQQVEEPPTREPASPIEIPDVGLIHRIVPIEDALVERRNRSNRYRAPF